MPGNIVRCMTSGFYAGCISVKDFHHGGRTGTLIRMEKFFTPSASMENRLKSWFLYFVYGAVFISLCAVALCMETSLLLGLPFNNFYFYLTVFSATLGQYNIHYYIKQSADPHSDRFAWSKKHKKAHLLLNGIGAIGLIIGFTGLEQHHFLVLCIIAAIAVLYSFPLLPFGSKRRLKDFGLLKIGVLTLVWSLITVWFPAVKSAAFDSRTTLVFIHRFLFIFILCLSFDIRDMRQDRVEKIRTIPIKIGVERSFKLIRILLLLFVILSFFLFLHSRQLPHLYVMIASALATYFAVEFTREGRSDLYYLFVVDGMMLVQPVLLFLVSLHL